MALILLHHRKAIVWWMKIKKIQLFYFLINNLLIPAWHWSKSIHFNAVIFAIASTLHCS